MKNFILRKPKFMRNDEEMMHYLRMIEALKEQGDESQTVEATIHLLEMLDELMGKAAKAGGFFTKKGLWRYIVKQATT